MKSAVNKINKDRALQKAIRRVFSYIDPVEMPVMKCDYSSTIM